MKKKALIFGSILALAVMVFGIASTGAWWTAEDLVEMNTADTGELAITMSGGPISVSNLEPGGEFKFAGKVCVQNTGNIDAKLRGYLDNVSVTPSVSGLGSLVQDPRHICWGYLGSIRLDTNIR